MKINMLLVSVFNGYGGRKLEFEDVVVYMPSARMRWLLKNYLGIEEEKKKKREI